MLGWIYILWLIFCTPLVPIGLICLVTYMIYSMNDIAKNNAISSSNRYYVFDFRGDWAKSNNLHYFGYVYLCEHEAKKINKYYLKEHKNVKNKYLLKVPKHPIKYL